jgi:hypothetical protein
MRSFVSTANATVAQVEASVLSTERTAADLAAYFGEDAKLTPPSKVFSVLRDFAAAFQSSLAMANRKKKAAGAAAMPITTAKKPTKQ